MNRSKLAVSISALLLPLLMGVGCTRERVVVVHDAAPAQPAQPAAGQTGDEDADPQEATADTEPPAEQAEAPGPAPSTGHIWIKGHWRWAGRRWVWRAGHWETIRHGQEWTPGHWERRHHNWVWVAGRWHKI